MEHTQKEKLCMFWDGGECRHSVAFKELQKCDCEFFKKDLTYQITKGGVIERKENS